ncbi:MAG: 2-C-methyl-D-erythritol 2,4-cyclodiphosphate synthase [Endomicrobia bacterium]|nr:2-C-methyl-D-erythritol 2,4-cyclodiphosphate synthase [Endomicrobiia bacterium]
MKYIIGIGYDSHKITKDRKLFLGGVHIDENFGLKGHSDADVIIHSICDAILSAIGEKDIGELFPPKRQLYKNLPSEKIAHKVMILLKNKKLKISNIDTVLICNKPNISKYKQKILTSLKKIFKVSNINIKGKTTEGIKCFENYIQCYSVVLIKK